MPNPAALPVLPGLGEILSLLAALFWAGAIVLFRVAGRRVQPLAVNLFKNALAVLLFALTAVLFGQPLLPRLEAGTYGVFLLSGFLGIAIADTLVLVALNKVGAEIFAIVDCGYSPFVIGLSFLFLGERLSPPQVLGASLIVVAVLLVGGLRIDAQLTRRDLLAGIAVGLVSVLLMAGGIVMVKPLLRDVPLLWGSLWRMIGGTAGVGLFLAFSPRRKEILRPLQSRSALKILIPASILATYLSSVSWLAGMSITAASVASVLNQMSTIFIFILAALFLKERITPLKLAAVALAFGGAVLVSVRF